MTVASFITLLVRYHMRQQPTVIAEHYAIVDATIDSRHYVFYVMYIIINLDKVCQQPIGKSAVLISCSILL